MFRKLLLFILTITYCLPSKAQPDSLLHTSYARKHEYVNTLQKYICEQDNILAGLDSLQTIIDNAKRANDIAFAYQLSFCRISIKEYINQPGAVKSITSEIEAAEQKGYKYEAADGKSKLSKYIWGTENRSKALELALEAYEQYRKMTVEEFPERINAQRSLANWYYYFEEYQKAKKLMLELVEVTSGTILEVNSPSINILALVYRQLGNNDSALYYFRKAYNIKSELSKELQRAVAAGNIGSVYIIKNNYDSSILWIKRELDLWKELGSKNNLATFSAYANIAYCYLRKCDITQAQKYMDSSTALLYKVRRSYLDFESYYSKRAEIEEASGNYIAALRYKDTTLLYRDSLNIAKNKAQMASAEQKIAEAEHNTKLLYLENLRQSSIWIRNFVILAIILLGVITLLLINRSRLRHKQRELKAVNEKTNAENKLLQFTRQMQQQNRQIEDLKDELQHMSDEHDMIAKNENIARLQQSTILTDEQWDEFRNMFEEVYSGFITRLKETFPGLTPAELRYLTLLKLDLTNKEMANMLGVNTNTVHNYKSRLRRKYAIADEVVVEDMVRNL